MKSTLKPYIVLDCGPWALCWHSTGRMRVFRHGAGHSIIWKRTYGEGAHLWN